MLRCFSKRSSPTLRAGDLGEQVKRWRSARPGEEMPAGVLDVDALIETRPIVLRNESWSGSAHWWRCWMGWICSRSAWRRGDDRPTRHRPASSDMFSRRPSWRVLRLAPFCSDRSPIGSAANVSLSAPSSASGFTLTTAYVGGLAELLADPFSPASGRRSDAELYQPRIGIRAESAPATIVSLLRGGFPLGGVIGGLVGSRMIPAYGWQSTLLVGGVLRSCCRPIWRWCSAIGEFLVAAGKSRERSPPRCTEIFLTYRTGGLIHSKFTSRLYEGGCLSRSGLGMCDGTLCGSASSASTTWVDERMEASPTRWRRVGIGSEQERAGAGRCRSVVVCLGR